MGKVATGATIFSFIIGFGVVVLWTWSWLQGGYGHLGIGTGYYTFDADREPNAFKATVARYDRRLIEYHPNASFFRLSGYGWFVDNLRGSEFSLAGIEGRATVCDYEMTNRVFQTEWSVRLPYWFILILAALLPAVWIVKRGIGRGTVQNTET